MYLSTMNSNLLLTLPVFMVATLEGPFGIEPQSVESSLYIQGSVSHATVNRSQSAACQLWRTDEIV